MDAVPSVRVAKVRACDAAQQPLDQLLTFCVSASFVSLLLLCNCSPLKAGFTLWGSGMVLTGLYLWKFKSHRPLSQNIIHARMVAQFGVIVGLCTGAAISAMELPKGHVAATSQERLVAINKAHEAAFTEEIEIEQYEAQMNAEELAAAEAAAASPDSEKL